MDVWATATKILEGHVGIWGRGEQGFASATSKPAPFAEKKNAKDAAPENSMRDLSELWCEAGGCHRPSSAIRPF